MITEFEILEKIVKYGEVEVFTTCLSTSKKDPFQKFWKKTPPCKVQIKAYNASRLESLKEDIVKYKNEKYRLNFESYVTIREFVTTKKGPDLVTIDLRGNSSFSKRLEFFETLKEAQTAWNNSIKEVITDMEKVMKEQEIKKQKLLNEYVTDI